MFFYYIGYAEERRYKFLPLKQPTHRLPNSRLIKLGCSNVIKASWTKLPNTLNNGGDKNNGIANFLNIALRSVFEVANILLILSKDGYMCPEKIQPLLSELEEQSRMLLAFRRRLKS